MRLYDAHNHLQDDRLAEKLDAIIHQCRAAGIVRMVVNGSCEGDWRRVAELARNHPDLIIPSFGLHPWYVHERGPDWQGTLAKWLDRTPGAVVGEIGLDRWKPQLSYEAQEEVFVVQLRMALQRRLPASIHCLKAWGRLQALLQSESTPGSAFLLHSFGGPVEMIQPLAAIGSYFSFPGYYLHPHKEKQRATFKSVPFDRLLLETDAPDQLPPEMWRPFTVDEEANPPANHPANLAAVYQGFADALHQPIQGIMDQAERNFRALFAAGMNTSNA